MLNVLVFPGSTEIAMEIWRALKDCKDVRLFSAAAGRLHHAPYVFQRHFTIPHVSQPDWLNRLNELIRSENIDYVFPAHDDALIALVACRERLGAALVCSPEETCRITRSKRLTYERLSHVVPTPVVFDNIAGVTRFPVFAKPDRGQGSQGVHKIECKEELWLVTNEDYIVTEYLPGPEFTVDCFSDRDRGLLFCAGRARTRTRNGIAMNCSPVRDTVFLDYARAISRELRFHGAWFFQLKKDAQGVLKLLEVAPRIAGTMALHRVMGVNLPLLSLYEQERIPVDIMPSEFPVTIDRALANRYQHSLQYRSAYVDLDDTLIVHGKVNAMLVMFLFQCIDRGVKLALLTRHRGDVREALRQHRLNGIFDEVIQIEDMSSKADYIHDDGAIFIDDSFRERRDVRERLGIPTFDCSMIELLLDERV